MKNTLNGVKIKSEERMTDFLSKCNNFKVLKKGLVNCESIRNKNIFQKCRQNKESFDIQKLKEFVMSRPAL